MPPVLFLITFAYSSPQQLRGILRCFYEKLFFAIAYSWEALQRIKETFEAEDVYLQGRRVFEE
jgi:hypothetical protein